MLDEIMKAAMEALELTSVQIDQARKALLTELASVDARAAAADALWHPSGSTTRLESAVPRAQQNYSDRRDSLIAAAPKFIALMLAAEVARERRDDAEKMLNLKWKAGSAAGSNGVPREVADWYPRLERHGVKRSYLGEFSNETVAVIADLIRWKAKDAKFRDPDNPWRAILGIYSARVIVRPDRKRTASLSKSGTPTKPRHVSSDHHYMFNEMFRELPPVPADPPAQDPPVSGILDCSVYPAATVAPLSGGGDAAAACQEAPDVDPIVDHADARPVQAGPESFREPAHAAMDVDHSEEYALPVWITNAQAAELKQIAEQYLAALGDWMWELRYEVDLASSDDDAIGRVRRLPVRPGETPYRYFLDEAKRSGVAAGLEAYRVATVARVMFEMATSFEWAFVRTKLGIQ